MRLRSNRLVFGAPAPGDASYQAGAPPTHSPSPRLLSRYLFKDHKSVRSMNCGRTDFSLPRPDCSERRVSWRYLIYWIFVLDSARARRRGAARPRRDFAQRRPLAYARRRTVRLENDGVILARRQAGG